MILLLGASGYVGQAFAHELSRRRWDFSAPTRAEVDYTRLEVFTECLRYDRPSLVINAAGFSGKPNVDACEMTRAETLLGNVLLPHMLAMACAEGGIPLGHVSSGCIYTGAKIQGHDGLRIEKDLTQPHLRNPFAERSVRRVHRR